MIDAAWNLVPLRLGNYFVFSCERTMFLPVPLFWRFFQTGWLAKIHHPREKNGASDTSGPNQPCSNCCSNNWHLEEINGGIRKRRDEIVSKCDVM